ncbi:phosphoglucosamine mutase, partial [Cylindrospermopsis raciborskii CS-506_D]
TTLSSSAKQWGKHYLRADLIGNYGKALQHPLQNQVNLSGMKIVLDVAWGAAVGIAPTIFTQMGADVICLHNQPDGDRINVNCGSTHLDILADAVKEYGAHIGFAFDGDADRVLAVDNLGRQVNGDYILYLWGCQLQGERKLPDNLIISTVMANLGFERAWKQQGGKLIRTAVGDQYVQAEMLKRGGMLGGEQSGHILCRHYGMTGDGLLTALHLASIVKIGGVSLAQMVDESFQTYPQVLQNVRVEDREKRLGWEKCQAIQQAIALAEVAMGDSGRILVRASGTEPVIRVMVEARDRELVNYWTREIVLQVQKHLG